MRARRRHSPTLVTCVVATIVLALTVAAVRVEGAGTPAAPEIELASGTLSLSNSLNGGAVLTASNLKPGDIRTGVVSVVNTGTLDGAFSIAQQDLVDNAGPFGGRLSDRLVLTLEQITLGGSLVSAVYSGPLSGLGSRQLGNLSAGEVRRYRFTIQFPDNGLPPGAASGDNAFQGSELEVDYVWTATNDEDEGGGGGGNGGGGGGGNGGVGPWPAPGGDPPFTLRLSGKKGQRPLRKALIVKAWCSAACELTWSVKVQRARKRGKRRRSRMVAVRVGRLRSRRPVRMRAGQLHPLKIKLPRRAKRKLKGQLRRRGRTIAVVTVTARAGAVKVIGTRKIALRR